MSVEIWDYNKLKKNYSYHGEGIPKLMVRTAKWNLEELPSLLRNLMLKLDPEYQQVYFSDRDVETFIEECFPQYLDCYRVLIPGAYKADLFRSLFIYKYGGIYNDIGNVYLVPVKEVIGNEKMVLTADNFYCGKNGIYNGFIASPPSQELFRIHIELQASRIRQRYYGVNTLDITGPACLWDAFCKCYDHPENVSIRDIKRYGYIKILKFVWDSIEGDYISDGEKKIIKTKVPGYWELVYPDPSMYYGHLWNLRKVYRTE
jgi:mannosyltransferase OCH1-like enzyme